MTAHHQRLPAGARPDWPRAAASGRYRGGGGSDLSRLEESAYGNGGATGGCTGRPRRHGHGALGARFRSRTAALPGGDVQFSKPHGATLSLAARRALLEAARLAGVPVVENDAYGDLRYQGDPLPSLKQLDDHGSTILLRSFSKVSFPGLRVGGSGAEAAHRPAASRQTIVRSAYRSALAGSAAGIRASRDGWKRIARACWRPAPKGWRRLSMAAAVSCRRARAGRSRRAA